MEIRYEKHWSSCLNRDMEFKVYGHGGKSVLFIPCQGGRFFDFENFKMLDAWADWIESGQCRVFSVDCIDNEAWAAQGADNRWRIENHERWYNYIVNELVPAIHYIACNGDPIMTFGCSMGAMHAANLYYRRPDLFDSCFAISGLYDNKLFFGSYCDDLVYNNCPCLYLQNMPQDHWYMDLYRSQKSLIVCGQGAWEEPLLESTRWLDTVCRSKGIPTRFEYWGYDVNHDWPWWFKMVRTYLPWLLG
ncbi:MAG: alpha/beta hydrolase-fold protein [Candidatus Faecousia sp.]|nr:alpha/beta hydrolase-fold protein [Clostridiales bacterium]MDY6181595.1 alpha/beta hydrolase-fold protein [Candidatus Faecousia sp.]